MVRDKTDDDIPPLTSECARLFPGGAMDDSTYSQIEDALDDIGAPMTNATGKWLTLVERIAALIVVKVPEHGR